jgi:hypothetical protein
MNSDSKKYSSESEKPEHRLDLKVLEILKELLLRLPDPDFVMTKTNWF